MTEKQLEAAKRIAAFLASYFDFIFAINRRLHPGEKRMLEFAAQCEERPQNMQDNIENLLRTGQNETEDELLIKAIIDKLDLLLNSEGLYPN